MKLSDLIRELQAIADAGNGEAPVIVRRDRDDGEGFVIPLDQEATTVCLLPYNSRKEPARILID
jgi:hypothetical protein